MFDQKFGQVKLVLPGVQVRNWSANRVGALTWKNNKNVLKSKLSNQECLSDILKLIFLQFHYQKNLNEFDT